MSTQSLQVQRPVVTHRNSRRLVAAASVAAALFVGGLLIGRSTAPTTSSSVVRPATELTLGESSSGDAARAEMFDAMNGLGTAAGDPVDVTGTFPGGTARLSHQRI
jgi:hypothetical protein